MPGRLEYERAIRRSDLPPPSRHLALTIATWADMDTGIIPDQFQPSLSTLAEATGLNRATVQRHLDRLEADGWIVRNRPDLKKAQIEHARTHYLLALPPEARCTEHLGLGAESTQPRRTDSPAKAQRAPRARRTEHHKSPHESQKSQDSSAASSSQQQRPDVEAVCTHLADVLEATGSKRPTVTAKWRDTTRKLIDIDGITSEQAIRAIDWAHGDDFWQAHILTPMKLREKYDTLRRQAAAKQRRGGSVRDEIPDWNNDPELKVNL